MLDRERWEAFVQHRMAKSEALHRKLELIDLKEMFKSDNSAKQTTGKALWVENI